MTTVTLKLDDAKARLFEEKARSIGREPEQLLAEFIDDIIKQPDAAFADALDKVLEKNRELYRRLA
jgi:hypothetical protein